MKVYIASWFASKDDMNIRANQLRTHGIEVTSTWLDELLPGTVQIHEVPDDYLSDTAKIDLRDVLSANVVVLNVPSKEDLETIDIPISSWARGGRHFEAGFQYATMLLYQYLPSSITIVGERDLVLVGHRENVFHFLDNFYGTETICGLNVPTIRVFDTWDEVIPYLTSNTFRGVHGG